MQSLFFRMGKKWDTFANNLIILGNLCLVQKEKRAEKTVFRN